MNNKVLLSVVVPCFNEEEVIGMTHNRIVGALGNNDNFDLEIVYVNDGSHDNTLDLIIGLTQQSKSARVVNLARNFGHQLAITAGMESATGDVVAIIDADLQDPPEVILKMYEEWNKGFDIVYGIRQNRRENIFMRMAYAAFYRLMRRLVDIDIPLDSGDFCLLDRSVVSALSILPERNRFVRGLRVWLGFRQTGVAYDRDLRASGKSKYSITALILLALDGIINFSVKPLTIMTYGGVVISAISLTMGMLYLIWRIFEFTLFGISPSDVPGFTSIIFLVFFFGGINILSIGILGEYIGRIYNEVKRRPLYVVNDRVGFSREIDDQNNLPGRNGRRGLNDDVRFLDLANRPRDYRIQENATQPPNGRKTLSEDKS